MQPVWSTRWAVCVSSHCDKCDPESIFKMHVIILWVTHSVAFPSLEEAGPQSPLNSPDKCNTVKIDLRIAFGSEPRNRERSRSPEQKALISDWRVFMFLNVISFWRGVQSRPLWAYRSIFGWKRPCEPHRSEDHTVTSTVDLIYSIEGLTVNNAESTIVD